MPGWTAETKPNARDTHIASRPDSPGYTPEQKTEVTRLRTLVLDLAVTVTTHPFWTTLDCGQVVAARMALKHAHEQKAPAGDTESSDYAATA
ncbi:hypothetical protein [Streptomyces albireticuli]|nr:hypothetical protein [Streptomyces albireticuli]